MALRNLGGQATAGIGAMLSQAFRPQPVVQISRDPFLRHFRSDFVTFHVELDGKRVSMNKIITATAGEEGYVDEFIRKPSGIAQLDINGQPSRSRIKGVVTITATDKSTGCSGCARKAAQQNKWWRD